MRDDGGLIDQALFWQKKAPRQMSEGALDPAGLEEQALGLVEALGIAGGAGLEGRVEESPGPHFSATYAPDHAFVSTGFWDSSEDDTIVFVVGVAVYAVGGSFEILIRTHKCTSGWLIVTI